MATRLDNISSDMIRWAIQRKGDSLEDFCADMPIVESWLDGSKKPTFNQLKKFATKSYVPLSYMFLPEPPEEIIPEILFRSGATVPTSDMSLNLLDAIRSVEAKQEWIVEYLTELGEDDLPFVGSVDLSTPLEDIVNDMRNTLDLDENWARSCRTWEDALRELVNRIEDIGVFVTSSSVVGQSNARSISVSECRGFTLSHPQAPFVFVNSADAKAAQMFTLVHELAHVWLGVTSAHEQSYLLPSNEPTELKADAIAAEFLVPARGLESIWRSHGGDYEALRRHYKVSSIVIARRALDLELITRSEFFEFYNRQSQEWSRQKNKSDSGGDYYAMQAKRIGKRFASYVISAARSQAIMYSDAYRLMGLRASTYDKFVSHVLR